MCDQLNMFLFFELKEITGVYFVGNYAREKKYNNFRIET